MNKLIKEPILYSRFLYKCKDMGTGIVYDIYEYWNPIRREWE